MRLFCQFLTEPGTKTFSVLWAYESPLQYPDMNVDRNQFLPPRVELGVVPLTVVLL